MSARSELIDALASAWVSAGLCPLETAVKDATDAVDAALAEHHAEVLREAADIAKECAQSWCVVSKDSADGASYVAEKLYRMAEELEK